MKTFFRGFYICVYLSVLWKGLAKIKKLNIDLQIKRKTSDEADAKFHEDINVSFSFTKNIKTFEDL